MTTRRKRMIAAYIAEIISVLLVLFIIYARTEIVGELTKIIVGCAGLTFVSNLLRYAVFGKTHK